MKKTIFFAVLVALLFTTGLTNAQSKMKLGVGAFVGLPMGTFGDITSIGFGGAVQGEYDMGDKLVGTLTTGYLLFSGKDVSGTKLGDWSIIPIMVGGKYFFAQNIYGTVQAGLNMVSYKIPATTYTLFGMTVTTPEQTFNETKFGYAIGVGYDMGQFDISAKYGTFATDASYLGVTALYKFGL